MSELTGFERIVQTTLADLQDWSYTPLGVPTIRNKLREKYGDALAELTGAKGHKAQETAVRDVLNTLVDKGAVKFSQIGDGERCYYLKMPFGRNLPPDSLLKDLRS